MTKVSVSDGKNESITKNYYDIDGKRIKKIENELETNYMYVGDSILYTTDDKGNKGTENILDPSGGIVSTKRFDGIYANKYFKYTYDVRGSIISILNPEVNRVKGYGYDDFGNVTEVGDSNFKNEIKYAGSVEDESSGLQYMNARHYNPTSGRFLNQDTYNDSNSPDLYSYAGNNPVNYVDPTGHDGTAVSDIWKIFETIGTIVGLAESGGSVGTAAGVISTPGVGTTIGLAGIFVILSPAKTVGGGKELEIERARAVQLYINSITPYWECMANSPISFGLNSCNKMSNSINGGYSGNVSYPASYPVSNGGITSFPADTYVEPLLNGIPKSQEIKRVVDNVARIQEKAKENAKSNEGTGEASLPNQGLVSEIPGAPPVDAGKQGKHVPGHNNYNPKKSQWPKGKNGVKETQEAWLKGKATRNPDIRTYTKDGIKIKVHIDKKGNLHGYPVLE